MKYIAIPIPDGLGRWATPVLIVVVVLVVLVKMGAEVQLGVGPVK